MRLFTLPLLISIFGFLSVSGQDLVYYTYDTPKSLTESRQSLSVVFTHTLRCSHYLDAANSLIANLHGHQQDLTERIIIRLQESSTRTLEQVLSSLFSDQSIIKSAAWGLQINPRLPVWLTDEILYQPGPGWAGAEVQEILSRYPGASLTRSPQGLPRIKVSELSHSLELANELVESGLVRWAHPNFMVQPNLYYTPPDPWFDKQFSFHNVGQAIDGNTGAVDMDVNAPEAWNLSLGVDYLKVGMVDEGVEDHEDLEDDSDGSSRVLPGYSPSGVGSGEPQDSAEGHGQSMAGLIAASHNSDGIAGMAPEVRIVPVYIKADEATALGYIADGYQWIWKVAEVDIISNSWGFSSCDENLFPAVVSAIEAAQDSGRNGKGCLVVFSAGKNEDSLTCVNFPGNNSNVFTVGSIDRFGATPDYTPLGPTIDAVVPSSGAIFNVRAIDRMGSNGFDPGNYVKQAGGTSSSGAIATGIAALVLSVDTSLTYSEIDQFLSSTAIDMGSVGHNDSTGFGRLNAFDAVNAASVPNGGFPVEWLEFAGRLQGEQVQLTWITAQERSNSHFEIQHSRGGAFASIGSLAGAGNSHEARSYHFVHQKPILGKNYYRIKQVDLGGAFTYSSVVEVDWAEVQALTLSLPYPNPTRQQVSLDLALPEGVGARYEVVDLQGKQLTCGNLAPKLGVQSLHVSVRGWAAGVYLLRVRSSQGKQSCRRIVVLPGA